MLLEKKQIINVNNFILANLKVISRKKSEIRDRLVFTWALPRLEYEEVDMLFGWLCNKDRL